MVHITLLTSLAPYAAPHFRHRVLERPDPVDDALAHRLLANQHRADVPGQFARAQHQFL